MTLEICVDSLESALAAERGGAHRVELCSNLNIGGTTPSQGLIELAKQNLSIEIYVMIRPRGGDFCYSELEFEVMKRDINNAKKMKVDGIVVGILKPNGQIDIKRMEEIIQLARPLEVTFHRAFDKSRDLFESLENLINLGVDRILTSGGVDKAIDGVTTIGQLVKMANDRVIIMPGSGVNVDNIGQIIEATGVKEIHLSARKKDDSKMTYRNYKINSGGKLVISEFDNFFASEDTIIEISNELKKYRK